MLEYHFAVASPVFYRSLNSEYRVNPTIQPVLQDSYGPLFNLPEQLPSRLIPDGSAVILPVQNILLIYIIRD